MDRERSFGYSSSPPWNDLSKVARRPMGMIPVKNREPVGKTIQQRRRTTSESPDAINPKLTGAGEFRVHVFVDGRHPAEYQRPTLLKHATKFERVGRVSSPRRTVT